MQTEIADYQKEFKEASLMVTDYSSVAFDFSYMKKPVIYTQFDISSSRGYFEEGKDGFGEVCFNYEDSVNAIIKNIKNDCKLDKKYEERINNFYYKFDNKNCERVHNEILKLK